MKDNQRNLFIIGFAVVILIVAFLLFSGNSPTVSAQGYSEIKAVPDKVSVYSSIEGRGADAKTAKDSHERILADVVSGLKSAGFSDEEIKQTHYSINPEYDWSLGSQKLIGYLASSSITLELSDFSKAAEVVDAVVDNGGFISWINFELSQDKQNSYKAEALRLASVDAKNKAKSTAEGLGKKLGSLESVQSSDFGYYPMPYYRGEVGVTDSGLDSKQAAVSISPRDIVVSGNVQVSYKLRRF